MEGQCQLVKNVQVAPEAEAEEPIYFVEDILKQRRSNGRLEYYVKWQNYSLSDCTWEPASNLHCYDIIDNFKKRVARARQEEKQNKLTQLKEKTKTKNTHSVCGSLKNRRRTPSETSTVKMLLLESPPPSPAPTIMMDDADDGSSGENFDNNVDVEYSEALGVNVETSNSIESNRNGFERGWIAEKILGAIRSDDGLLMVVKFEGQPRVQILSSKLCNDKCPLKVIAFYEERLDWIND